MSHQLNVTIMNSDNMDTVGKLLISKMLPLL